MKKEKVVLFVWIVALVILFFFVINSLKFSVGGSSFLSLFYEKKLMFPLVTVAALIDSVNPCAFSILFLTIAFLFSLGRTRRNILFVGGAYILGVFLVYVLIGLGVLKTLQFFNVPHFVARIGGAILIFSGVLSLINHFIPSFPIKLGIPQRTHRKIAVFVEKASIPSALVLGFFVGMWEFPCTGGPYLMVLGLLHDRATFFSGFGYLVWYNTVFVLPLALILFVAGNEMLLKKVEDWKKENVKGRLIGGVAMILLGTLIFLF